MKLKSLFECFKCFMIGNYKETNSGIEDNLFPKEKPIEMYNLSPEIPSGPLYTPPIDDMEDPVVKDSVNDCTSLHDDFTSDEHGINTNTDVFKCMSDLIVELDTVKQKLTNNETIQMITFCQDKIIEGLSSSGAELIDNDESYSNIRHYPIPYGIYPEGIPIRCTIRPGVIIQNDVVLKALIEL